jgi:hypothetical protein
MKIVIIALMFAGILFSQAISFSKAPDPNLAQKLSESKGATTLYIENKGQIGDQHGKPNNEVKYLILRPGLNIQLKANSFSYDAYTVDRFKRVERLEEPFSSKLDKQNDDSLVYHFSRVDIELVDANPNPQITHEGASSDYLNYYTNITSQTQGEAGATGVRGYSKITYQDIYPNIDLEWFIDKDGKPEYQFIINPGGDPSRIRLRYHGAEKTELISEAIHIHIKPGIIKEHIPLSYLKESKEKLQIVFAKVADNEYGFSVPTYVSNETLIIDPMPNRLWATYYGGTNSDIILSSAIANDGSIYVSGKSNSTNFIATSGSHQSTLAGNYDAFVSKQSESGNRLWATYYGGSGEDIGLSVVCDNSLNVYLGGQTNSSSGIATTGSHQSTFAGNADGFIVKFNSIGILSWGTYYGGDTYEYAYIATDGTNIFIAGRTESSTAIATAGAYQTSIAGLREAYLAKFTASGIRVWGTYIGGSDHEYLYSVKCDQSGNVLVAGGTGSSSGIATSGAHQTVNNGGLWDSFLMKFNTNGNILWGTYYGGSSGDMAWNISTDNNSNIYISGITESSNSISTSGIHQTNYGGGPWDAFVVKFSSNGVRQWGTYYGGSGDESSGYGGPEVYPPTISCDNTGNILLTGNTTSSNNVATNDGYDNTYNGMKDAFLVKLTSSGQREWGTYYGSTSDDQATTIVTDGQDVYIAGTTSSTSSISSTGALQTVYGGGTSDGFIVKFNISVPQSITTSISKINYCQSESFQLTFSITGNYTTGNIFTAQLSDQLGSFTNPTVIGTLNSTNSGTINCTIPLSTPIGSGYRIRVIASNPVTTGSDNGSDITINPIPNPIVSGSNSVCQETTYNYTLPSISDRSYQWSTPNKGIIVGSNNSNSVNIKWTASGTDTIKVRETNLTTGCFADAFYVVTINTLPNPSITGLQQVCFKQSSVMYSVPQLSGFSYEWFQPSKGVIVGSSSNNSCIVNWSLSFGLDSIKIRQTNLSTGCFKDIALSVLINPLPIPVITGSVNVCTNQPGLSYSVPFISGHTYQWYNPTLGQIMSGGNSNVVSVNWGAFSGIDQLKVRQTNTLTGCSKDTSLLVIVNESPNVVISGAKSVCMGSNTVSYSTPIVTSHTYQWYAPTKGIISGSSTGNSIAVNWTESGLDSIRVRQINTQTGCFKDTLLQVVIHGLPLPVISGPKVICQGESNRMYSVLPVSGHENQWSSVRNGVIKSSKNGNSVIIDWINPGIDTLNVRQKNIQTGCIKDTSFIVTILPKPEAVISGDTTVCISSPLHSYEIKDTGDSYFWYPPILGDLMSGQTGKSVQVRWSKLGVDTLRISIKNLVTGCVRDSFLVVKIVNSIQPLIEAFGNQNFLCRGDSRGLECLTEGQSYQWKKDGKNIDGANGKSYLAFEAGEYSVKTKSGFCEGESDKITLIEYEVPKPSIIGTKEVNVGSLNVSYKVSDIGIKNTVWSISNNASIIGEHNKNEVLVQFYEPGIVFLVVKQESINECIGEDSLSIFVNSINDVNFKNATFDAINISPNPIGESDQLQLHFSEISNQDITIELLDILGSVHSSNTLQAGSESCIIPVQGLSSGMYMLRVRMNNGMFIEKVIVN